MGKVAELYKQLLIELEGQIRPGTLETPERVERAWAEMLDGYKVDIPGLFKKFDGEGLDQIVAARSIPFVSFCEHHLLIFEGVAHVAYLPSDCAVGASKLARIVIAYAHRLQIQERMTEQIAHTIEQYLHPRGVAVIIEAKHSCMSCRGVRAVGAEFITSIMLGRFRDNESSRLEVLSLLGLKC